MSKINYYSSFDEDIIKSSNQDYKLKDNYKYIHKNIFYIILSYLLYYLVLLISFIYTKLILRIKIKNKKVIKNKNYYIYSNHTLTLGDVLNPFIINFPRKPYIICSSANLGIPIIGKILPLMGAIVIPDNINGMKKFVEAINIIEKKHPIVIYPEAHLWPYYTKIRDYESTSFRYPASSNIDVYSSTTIFKKGIFKKPKIEIYIDGPFKNKSTNNRKENELYLKNLVYNTMLKRSKNSSYEYIKYEKR